MHGYTCDSAASGFETLEVVKKKTYDLILMDIQMPGMSGEETMHSIHELYGEKSPNSPTCLQPFRRSLGKFLDRPLLPSNPSDFAANRRHRSLFDFF